MEKLSNTTHTGPKESNPIFNILNSYFAFNICEPTRGILYVLLLQQYAFTSMILKAFHGRLFLLRMPLKEWAIILVTA